MSWTASKAGATRGAVAAMDGPEGLGLGAAGQFRYARSAVLALIDSATVGDPELHTFNVSLAGHANPGHEPAEGWSNDCVSVSVSQALPVAP